jgi:hypothetical protein
MSDPSGPLAAALQGVPVAFVLLLLGYLIARSLVSNQHRRTVLPFALALPCVIGFALLLMLAHFATGGRVFANALLVRGVTLASIVALALWQWRTKTERPSERRHRLAVIAALAVAGVGLILWSYAATKMIPLHFAPDTRVHMGYANLLINGSPTPTAALSGNIPNFYPWLFHALVAFVARLTPGGNAFHAMVPVHFLFVVGAVLSLFTLGQRLTGKVVTGLWAALFGGLAGGIGFVVARGPAIVVRPQGPHLMDYLGDLLLIRSHNFALSNLVPPFPRDLTYALFLAFVLLLMCAVQERSTPFLIGAGAVLGGIGLAGGEALFAASSVALLVILATGRDNVLVRLIAVALPAGIIYAVWAAPLFINYFRHGGFFDMSSPPLEMPLWAIAASWGVSLPLGIYGAAWSLPRIRGHPARTVAAAVLAGSIVVLIGSGLILTVLGEGFAPLSRISRYWPLVHVGVVLFAAIGATEVLSRLRKWPVLASLTVIAILLVALPSPVLIQLAYPQQVSSPDLVTRSLVGQRTVLEELDTPEGVECTIVAPQSISPLIFAYDGHRIVAIILGRMHKENLARVRWRDIYRVTEDFSTRFRDSKTLMSDRIGVRPWRELIAKYGVDAVVKRDDGRGAAPFSGLPARSIATVGAWAVAWVDDCKS